jgi:hypothetical protein
VVLMWPTIEWIRIIALMGLELIIVLSIQNLVIPSFIRVITWFYESIIALLIGLALNKWEEWPLFSGFQWGLILMFVLPKFIRLLIYIFQAENSKYLLYALVTFSIATLVMLLSFFQLKSSIKIACIDGISLSILLPASFLAVLNRFKEYQYSYPYDANAGLMRRYKLLIKEGAACKLSLDFLVPAKDIKDNDMFKILYIYSEMVGDMKKLGIHYDDIKYATEEGKNKIIIRLREFFQQSLDRTEQNLEELEKEAHRTWRKIF